MHACHVGVRTRRQALAESSAGSAFCSVDTRARDNLRIPDPPTRPDLAQSIYHWISAIAPSGAAFYTGDKFPTWRGNLLIGGLVSQALIRLTLNGQRVTGEERIALGDRIREVQQEPDGFIYLLTDNPAGRVLKIEPASAPVQTIL